jgi:hypothetical protein
MKRNLATILEALFIPKPNEYLQRNQLEQNHGLSLIPIPVRIHDQDPRQLWRQK